MSLNKKALQPRTGRSSLTQGDSRMNLEEAARLLEDLRDQGRTRSGLALGNATRAALSLAIERLLTRPAGPDSDAGVVTQPPPTSESVPVRRRDMLNRDLMGLYRPYLNAYPETRFVDVLRERYGVAETRLMSVEQLTDLCKYLTRLIGERHA